MTTCRRGGNVDEDARDALPHRADRARVRRAGPPEAGMKIVEALGAVDDTLRNMRNSSPSETTQ